MRKTLTQTEQTQKMVPTPFSGRGSLMHPWKYSLGNHQTVTPQEHRICG